MLIQNITFDAVTGWPLDHLYGLSVMVTLFPLKVGALATLSEAL